jgi:hypothetical protein
LPALNLMLPVAEAQTQTMTMTSDTKSLPAGTLEAVLVTISDNEGFEKPMVAAKALIPKGWKTEGGVRWSRATPGCADPATFAWAAVSPDGLSRIELVPTELWNASNSLQLPCQYGEFQDMASYLAAYIQRRYPGARLGQYTQRHDFLDLQRDYIQAQLQMINNSGLGLRGWADAGEMTFTAKQNGVEIEGVVGGTAKFMMGQTMNPLGGPPLMSLTAQTTSAFAATGPKGKFDRQTAEAVRKSVKVEGEWGERYFDFFTRLGGMRVQATKDRAGIIVAAGAALTASTIAANKAAGERAVRNSYADPKPASSSSSTKDDTDDRIHRKNIDGLRGVETYDDPVYGGTVQLDNTYDHAWRVNNADSYILTNDPNFNPGLYDIDAQQLKVAR